MGGVLIDLSIDRMMAAFTKIADLERMPKYSALDLLGNGGHSALHEYECGHLSTDEWIEATLATCLPNTTHQQVIDASFAILGDIPAERLLAIRSLRKKGYRVFLLSNIQDLHWDYISTRYLGGIDVAGNGFNDHTLFDDVVLSQRVGYTKPDSEIYEALLSRTGICPEESLYIDDVMANVEAGRRFGLCAAQATGNEWLDMVLSLPSLIEE